MYIDMESIEEFLRLLETGMQMMESEAIKPFVFITRVDERFDDGITIRASVILTAMDPFSENRDIIRFIEPKGTTKYPVDSLKENLDTQFIYEKYKANYDRFNADIETRTSELIKLFKSKNYDIFKGVLTT